MILFIYLLGVMFVWFLGFQLYGVDDDLEMPTTPRQHFLGVFIVSLVWPLVAVFIASLRFYWWLMDKWESYEGQK